MEIIIERDAPKLSRETGLPISRCVYALEEYKDYELAKKYLLD
jgi:hypothetical protein